jgi:tetratricopeptide (TPR) repeat protein
MATMLLLLLLILDNLSRTKHLAHVATAATTTTTSSLAHNNENNKNSADHDAGDTSASYNNNADEHDGADAKATVTVGEITYTAPFEQHYPAPIAAILRRFYWSSSGSAGSRERYFPPDNSAAANTAIATGAMDEAVLAVELGTEHRTYLLQWYGEGQQEQQHSAENSQNGDGSAIAEMEFHEHAAIQAFQHSIQLYQGLLAASNDHSSNGSADDDPWGSFSYHYEQSNVQHHLASAYLGLAETYMLIDTKRDLAQDYYQQAYDLFDALLRKTNPPVTFQRDQLEASWAHCCLRLGVALLSGKTSAAGSSSMVQTDEILLDLEDLSDWQEYFDGSGGSSSSSTNDDRTELLQGRMDDESGAGASFRAMQRQQRQLVGRAIQYFERAEQVYRRMQPNELHSLATTLQNLATAHQMIGALVLAVRYNEEALDLYYGSDASTSAGSAPIAVDMTVQFTVAELLYTLSDAYLRQGKYDASIDSYQQASKYAQYLKYRAGQF